MKKSIRRAKLICFAAVLAALLGTGLVFSQGPDDNLTRGFQNPPASAKPRVWWHWMSGNITKEGIKADLEWMKRAGIAGFQNFDAGLETPQIVEKRLVFMTPAWKDAFTYTATLADQLGLEMAIAGSPGWSESGGAFDLVSLTDGDLSRAILLPAAPARALPELIETDLATVSGSWDVAFQAGRWAFSGRRLSAWT